jgi:hypothetical protein
LTHDVVEMSGSSPLNVSDEVWRVADRLRVYFGVNIDEPTEPHEETVVKSATFKIYKRAVHPERLVSSDIVDRSIRVDVYQITDLQVRAFFVWSSSLRPVWKTVTKKGRPLK